MVLSRINPNQFYKVLFALKDGFDCVGHYRHEAEGDEAPGISGAYKMLRDEDLWHALKPLIAGIKVFAERLDQEEEKPISAFSGKSGGASG